MSIDTQRTISARYHFSSAADALHLVYWMDGRDDCSREHHMKEARQSLMKAFGCDSREGLAIKISAARIDAMAKGAATDVTCADAVIDMLFDQIGISDSAPQPAAEIEGAPA